MASKKVLIKWRTHDKHHGVQQRFKRKDIQPEGTLKVGQEVKVKFSRRFYDAVIVESWPPKSDKKGRKFVFCNIYSYYMYFVTGGVSELFLDDVGQIFIHVKLSFETTLVQLNG